MTSGPGHWEEAGRHIEVWKMILSKLKWFSRNMKCYRYLSVKLSFQFASVICDKCLKFQIKSEKIEKSTATIQKSPHMLNFSFKISSWFHPSHNSKCKCFAIRKSHHSKMKTKKNHRAYNEPYNFILIYSDTNIPHIAVEIKSEKFHFYISTYETELKYSKNKILLLTIGHARWRLHFI